MSRSVLFRLFASVWLVFVFHFTPLASLSDKYVLLERSLAEQGRLDIDEFQDYSPEKAQGPSGHQYIMANPGLGILAAPGWFVVFRAIERTPLAPLLADEPVHYFLVHLVGLMTTTAPLSALVATGLAWFVWRRTGERWRAVLSACTYSFGSIAFYYSTRIQQNAVISFAAFAAFLLIYEPFTFVRERPALRSGLIGLLLCGALLVDLSILPMGLCLAVPTLRRTSGVAGWIALVSAAVVPVVALLAYQQHAFGNALLPPQAYLATVSNSYHTEGFIGLTPPRWSRVIDYLLSPAHGILLFMPFAVPAVWYSVRRPSGAPALETHVRRMTHLAIAMYLLYVACVQASVGTLFGPRYLMPIVPLLCLLLGVYLPPRPSAWIMAAIGWSFLVNIAGTQIGVGSGNVFVSLGTWLLRGPWLPVLDWAREVRLSAGGMTMTRVTPYGLFMLLAALLAWIWWPFIVARRRDRQIVS